MSIKIPLTRPYTGDQEKTIVAAAVESGWLTQGFQVTEFEHAVAEYLRVDHAIAVSHCTAALHLALLLHGIGAGHEVLVPSYTWITTANVVRLVGATPVFVDIDLATFNITPRTIESVVTPRSTAIMPVHQFGLPVDMDGIEDVARRSGLIVIEDAACALGSCYRGRRIGSLEHAACFSFHPRKVVTTGEGGMLVTNNAEMAARARVLRNHGASASDLVKHRAGSVDALEAEQFHEVGYNYRMTDLQGGLGRAQMRRLDEILALRRMRAERYSMAFRKMSHVIPPHVPDYASPNWQSYVVRISDDCPVGRDVVAQRLLDAGIACRPGYMACHTQPAYRNLYPELSLPNTEKALTSVIILPLYPQMTDEEQDYVIKQMVNAVEAGERWRL
jgi:dTDP-4-amino-4,6-dideoxygalactose transaminase